MDITAIYRTCLEVVRQRNKELSLNNPSAAPSKTKIFPSKKAEYTTQARDLSKTITGLRDYLLENRTAYLNITPLPSSSSVFSASGSGKPTMTDVDRDLLDNDVQKIIHSSQKKILDFEKAIESTEKIYNNPHLKTHLESVSESLTKYLKEVTIIFSEMKAVRVKRTVDYQNMTRLSSTNSAIKLGNKNRDSSSDRERRKRDSVLLETEEADGRKSPTVPDYFLDDDGEIPPEELQLLEEENATLLNQLHSVAQEVDQIQSNVVQIAQLQEIFTEKVLQQEKDIDKISSVVVGATENIKGGNEQIRQAIQKNADFRVWVLFFILVMSFSLLFLDWYND